MKKINLKFGGHPIKNDDASLMQDSYTEIFKTFVSIFDSSLNTILNGFVITDNGTTISCTAGAISWQGEVFQVPATSFPVQAGGNLYLKLVEQVLPPSPVQYKDGTLQNVHLNRTLQFKYFTAGDIGEYLAAFSRVSSLGFKRGMILDYQGNIFGNFDNRGLGINDMSGFAICNGNTFTITGGIQYTVPDLRGRSRIGGANLPNQDAPPYNAIILSNPNVGQSAGSAFITLTKSNMPNYNLDTTVNINVTTTLWAYVHRIQSGNPGEGLSTYSHDVDPQQKTISSNTVTSGVTVNTGGSNQPFDNRGAWWAGIPIIKL